MSIKKYCIGVDVGGTNISMGVVDNKGNVVHRSSLTTKAFISNKTMLITALVEKIKDLINACSLSPKHIKGIGIGLPGLIDPPRGVVIFLPNIPGWRNVPLKNILEKKLRIPTFIDNDVNIITLSEWRFGAGVGYRDLVCLTLGTGVGSGLIVNNALYRGPGFAAGELGHIPLNEKGPQCNCGGLACLEVYVGNKRLQLKAARIFNKKDITLEDVSALAKKGNKRALSFWEDTAIHIGNGLTGVVNLLNPRLVIIGGGVSNSQFLIKTIQKTIKQRAMKVQGKMVKVVKARLGNSAGIIGGQALVCSSIN